MVFSGNLIVMRQVTIKDLAEQLNISFATVSRALRNAPDINRETKKAVIDLANRLHYEPNYIAQSLVKKQTRIIGVIVPSIQSNYFSQALSGMTDVATENNYYLMICQSNETGSQELSSIRKLVSCHVDGLLISISKETTEKEEFDRILEKEIPIVMFDRILPDFRCSKVIVDEYEGAFKAVEHLIKRGCRRIAHLAGPRELSVSNNRKNGYLDALKKHRLNIDESLIIHCRSFEDDALKNIKKLIRSDPRPDGIFFINDLSAITAIKYLQKQNIRVPEDIKLVGFNNDPVSAVVEPSLTTVMQPGYEVGKLAIGTLIDQISKHNNNVETFKLRTKLIQRNSSR
jgi:DNA-binding LacI/PurR family transcriptional regulator